MAGKTPKKEKIIQQQQEQAKHSPSTHVLKVNTITVEDSFTRQKAVNDFYVNIPKWVPVAILIFTAILYSRDLQNGFTGFDDDFYVTRNPLIRDFSWHGIVVIFTSLCYYLYLPLTIFLYLLEYKLFGLNPLPYHALNVLLHLMNIWLVFKLTEKLSGSRLTAFIVSVLFAVHPMHVESVAWISELKDVLYSLFYLSSLLLYLRYLDAGYRAKHYHLALLLFVLSLLSKPAAVTLPVLLIAIDLYKGRKLNTRLLLEKAPFLLLSLIFGIVMMVSHITSGTANDINTSYGFINGFFLVTYPIQYYFIQAVFPHGLSAMHHYPPLQNGLLPWQYYTSLLFVVFIAWVVLRRSSFRKELLFGSSFFLIAVSTMLMIVSAGSALVAERYTYISYIGLFYIAGQWISKMGIDKWKKIVVPVFSLLVISYSVQTWARIIVWKDSMTLFGDMTEKEPGIYYGYYMRGNAEKSDGDLQAAMEDYNTAISLDPGFEDVYYNRGTLYDASGNYKSAISDYSNSIRLNPRLPDAYNNRGWAYFQSGDTAAALRDLSTAISLKPDYAQAYNNRGWIYYKSGNTKLALPDFDKAILINPGFDKPIYNRALLKETTGDITGAIADFSTVSQLRPADNSIFYYRGLAHIMQKDTSAACMDFQKANQPENELATKMLNLYCH